MRYGTRRSFAFVFAFAFACLASASVVLAQAAVTPQQYEDVQRQLQQSQDRKNQLADENAKLKARVAEVEQRLRVVEASERTYFLRAHYAAWQAFIDRYPLLLNRFQAYLNNGNVGLSSASADGPSQAMPVAFFDADWPFSAAVITPDAGGATR